MGAQVVKGTNWGLYSCPSFDSWASLTKSKEKETKIKNCFEVQLKPNPLTWQTSCIYGARCNFEELYGIHMSKVSEVLLGKRATTGSLSKNLVCQFSSKRWVTHYPKVTKNKNKHGWRSQPLTNQIKCSYELKEYISVVSICGSCLKFFQLASASW